MKITSRGLVVAAIALAGLGLASCEKARAPGSGAGTGDATDVTTPEGPPPPLAGKVELVELVAEWNPACRMQARATEEVRKRYGAWAKITRVDVEADRGAAERYGPEAKPPAFAILVEGKVTRRLEDLQSADELSAALDEALGRSPVEPRRVE
ncbi:MAG: thioredoxin family protein [Planctomycetota bacterium]|jgi:thiol-disulfide isomerase/thioredoxin